MKLMPITRTSLVSGKVHTLELAVTEEQLRAYEQRMFLQDAFPKLSPPEREFIKTGITPDEWQSEVLGIKAKDDEPSIARTKTTQGTCWRP